MNLEVFIVTAKELAEMLSGRDYGYGSVIEEAMVLAFRKSQMAAEKKDKAKK